MKNSDSRRKVIKIIKNIIQKDQNKATDILLDRLNDKLNRANIYSILDTTRLDELDVIVLLWIYSAFTEFYNNIDSADTHFTNIEIEKAETYHVKRKESAFPIIFNKVTKVNDGEEYKFLITIQEFNTLMKFGVIKLVEGMQRESVETMYDNKIVSHVAYNDSKAREIGRNIVARAYHPKDDISIHLITDGEEDYYYDGDELKIKSGNLALLDGQHREAGTDYALMEDRDINMLQSIYFTVGTVEMAQNIIAQHERQTPINKSVVESYANSDGKLIFTRFSLDSTISRYYKFVDNYETVIKGYGIATSSDIIKSINKYYNGKLSKIKERNDITNWMIEFFTELIYIYEDDLVNFKNVRMAKWNVSQYAFPCYVYLSSHLYEEDNWKEQLVNILNEIDFSVATKGKTYNVNIRNALKIFNDAIERCEKL